MLDPFTQLMETRDKIYRKWLKDLEERIDPRVWTHCELRVTRPEGIFPGREEMWCDGTLRGVFITEQVERVITFTAKVVML